MWDLTSTLKNAFPSYLENDVNTILEKTNAKQMPSNYPIRTFPVLIGKEKIEIPCRHTLNEIQAGSIFARIANKEITLTETQQNIIDCFYTRHCNGFKREHHLKNIIRLNHEWVVPYVIQLVGEYVIEILNVIYQNLDDIDVNLYKEFIKNNIDFYELTTQRVVSYWDCYYRWLYKYRKDYVGFKILDFINANVLK